MKTSIFHQLGIIVLGALLLVGFISPSAYAEGQGDAAAFSAHVTLDYKENEQTFDVAVQYQGLIQGQEYRTILSLVDAKEQAPLVGADGKALTKEVTFTAEGESPSITSSEEEENAFDVFKEFLEELGALDDGESNEDAVLDDDALVLDDDDEEDLTSLDDGDDEETLSDYDLATEEDSVDVIYDFDGNEALTEEGVEAITTYVTKDLTVSYPVEPSSISDKEVQATAFLYDGETKIAEVSSESIFISSKTAADASSSQEQDDIKTEVQSETAETTEKDKDSIQSAAESKEASDEEPKDSNATSGGKETKSSEESGAADGTEEGKESDVLNPSTTNDSEDTSLEKSSPGVSGDVDTSDAANPTEEPNPSEESNTVAPDDTLDSSKMPDASEEDGIANASEDATSSNSTKTENDTSSADSKTQKNAAKSSQDNGSTISTSEAPVTGDETKMLLLAGILTIAVIGIVAIFGLLYRKRKHT